MYATFGSSCFFAVLLRSGICPLSPPSQYFSEALLTGHPCPVNVYPFFGWFWPDPSKAAGVPIANLFASPSSRGRDIRSFEFFARLRSPHSSSRPFGMPRCN